MDQEQLNQIITAVKAVASDYKSVYDYIILCLPVITGILGWFASIWWQGKQFKKNNEKEHYYHVRDKIEQLVTSYNELLDGFYTFNKTAKNKLNPPQIEILNEDYFNDFITQFQFQLARIHQIQKLMFPGSNLEIRNILAQANSIIESISSMNKCRTRLKELGKIEKAEDKKMFEDLNSEAKKLNLKNAESIELLTKAIGRIENEIIELSNAKAKKLGIT